MPHLRKRHLEGLVKKTLNFSPIVGILGHRQVGKTTLSSVFSDNYISLDRRDFLDLAERSQEELLSRSVVRSPLIIDECQFAPVLFPALKEWVRTHRKPGQFILTGSVRFTSRKAIRESLTGRIINWELLPLSLSESYEAPLPDAIPRFLKSKTVDFELKEAKYFSIKAFEKMFTHGGLPGIYFLRDFGLVSQRFETQIEALLERDLSLVLQTSIDFRTLKNLLVVLASKAGQPLVLTEISRSSKISVPALSRIIRALESLFIVRIINSEGTRKKSVLFFEDLGEARYLGGITPTY